MKKQFLNLGKALNKAEQKEILGGKIPDLSVACGYVTFNSVESQCLGLDNIYQPQWNASAGTCSAAGQCMNTGAGGSMSTELMDDPWYCGDSYNTSDWSSCP